LKANATGGDYCTGVLQYSWSDGSNYWDGTAFASPIELFSAAYHTIVVNVSSATTTTIHFAAHEKCSTVAACSSAPSLVPVTVRALPAPPVISPASADVCEGTSLALTASGAASYHWTPAADLDQDSSAAVSVTPTDTVVYTVTGTDAFGCFNTSTALINFLPAPAPVLTPASAVCQGLNNLIAVTGNVVGNYSWSPVNSGFTTNNAQNSSVNIQTQGTPIYYTVTGTQANGCTVSNVIGVASTPLGGTVSPAASVVCSGTSKTFTLTGQFGNIQWQKSVDNATWTDIAGATNTTFILGGIVQTTYVRALAKTQICYDVASTSAVVFVSATPTVTVTQTTSTSVTVAWAVGSVPYASGTDYTVSWSGAAGSGSQVAASPFTILNLSPNAALTVTVTKLSGSCAGTSPGTVGTATRCAVPQNVHAQAVTNAFAIQGLKVSWNAVPSATGYRVYYRPLGMNANWSYQDTTGGTQKTIQPLYAGAAYAVMVAANGCPVSGQLGEASAVLYGVYTNTAPTGCGPIPTVLSATSTCPNQITVNLSGGPTWQVTLRRLSPSFSAGVTYQTTSAVTNFTVATSTTGSVWEVFAQTVCGGTVYSQISNVKTVAVKAPCEAPLNVILSHPTCHGFAVSWNALVCAGIPLINYQVYIKLAAAAGVVSEHGLSGVRARHFVQRGGLPCFADSDDHNG